MKILWATNVSTPDGAEALSALRAQPYGGWLVTLSKKLAIMSGVALHIACPSPTLRSGHAAAEAKGITHHAFSPSDPQALPALLREVAPDFVHIFGTEMSHAIAISKTCRMSGIPYVVSIQGIASEIGRHFNDGLPTKTVLGWTLGDRLRRINLDRAAQSFVQRGHEELEVLRNATLILGRTQFDRAFVDRAGLGDSYRHVSESLRPSFFEATWSPDECTRHQLFVSQASYPVKGLHTLIEALPSIIERFPDTTVLVAGDNLLAAQSGLSRLFLPSYHTHIRRRIRELGLGKAVAFIGALPETRYQQALLSSHVAVCPSSVENSPNSVAEAMALGVPVVASFAGGIPTLVVHGETGLLHQPQSPLMLADHIRTLFSDDELALRLSVAAQKGSRESFSPQTNLTELLDVYHELDSLSEASL